MEPVSGASGGAIHRRLFRLASSQPGFLPMSALICILAATATVAQMYLLARVIDAVFAQHAALAELQASLWILLGVIALRAGVSLTSEAVAQRAAISIKASLRERLSSHFLELGPVFTTRERTGELVSTTVDGVEKLDAYFARFLPGGLAMVIIPTAIGLVIFSFDWLSGLILAITAPLILIFMWLIGTMAARKTSQQWER